MTEEETDGDDDKQTTRSTKTQTTSTPLRQKYVTLSRNKSRDSSSGSISTSSNTQNSPGTTTSNKFSRPSTVASSSTETSVVVRYSNDDAFIPTDSADSNGDEVKGEDDAKIVNRASSFVARLLNNNPYPSSISSSINNGDKSGNRYVTISRPYARVAGTSNIEGGETVVGDSTSNKGTISNQSSRQRYVLHS